MLNQSVGMALMLVTIALNSIVAYCDVSSDLLYVNHAGIQLINDLDEVESSADYLSNDCNEITEITVDSKGAIRDGSGAEEYANNTSCKWLIKAPKGKRIKFSFAYLDTQINVDNIHLIDGAAPILGYSFARFSGDSKTPPKVVSRTNEVLVWFETNNAGKGQGWELMYEVVD